MSKESQTKSRQTITSEKNTKSIYIYRRIEKKKLLAVVRIIMTQNKM